LAGDLAETPGCPHAWYRVRMLDQSVVWSGTTFVDKPDVEKFLLFPFISSPFRLP
jgi:hypothetical protein